MARNSRVVLVAVIIVVILLIGSGYYFRTYLLHDGSQGNTSVCQNLQNTAPGIAAASSPSNTSSTVTFTIIESDSGPYEGMNGSAYHLSTQWPLMIVHQGQTVVIHVYNCASSEAHGFAITHYFNQGITIHPGQSFTEIFTANQVGNFTVYCNVFCAIHPLMQNGALEVIT